MNIVIGRLVSTLFGVYCFSLNDRGKFVKLCAGMYIITVHTPAFRCAQKEAAVVLQYFNTAHYRSELYLYY